MSYAKIVFWSRGGATKLDSKLRRGRQMKGGGRLPFEDGARFYVGRLKVPAEGTMVLQVWSPRPLRLWLDDILILDEGIFWRSYQRELRAAITVPCRKGTSDFRVEVGPRPAHPAGIDEHCPSRNRARVMRELKRLRPDVLLLSADVTKGATAAMSFRFLPNQFRKDGIVYQHVLARRISGVFDKAPSTDHWAPTDEPEEKILLHSGILPGTAIEGTTTAERERGLKRFYVPVLEPGVSPKAVRSFGRDKRVEPSVEVADRTALSVEGSAGRTTVTMPIYETLGRHAPKQEFQDLTWPEFKTAKPLFPEPVLPEKYAWMSDLYYAAWEMLIGLVRHPNPDSGLPGPYVSTGSGFKHHQFVWDTSFTALATAYGHRVIPAYCSLDLLYSRQFDGGYIHREHEIRDGLPALYEPDFSPNPPIMCVAEWANFSVTADVLRLKHVYPALKGNHVWLRHNRRLPDGTYWTTGLANGLDNSPSLGDGYPCLTSQMAHEAETLAKIAGVLGLKKDVAEWMKEYRAVVKALNQRLWSEKMRIYSTSLRGGGHNPNKVVTAFWPLWAGAVPPERVDALAQHLKDPTSFWRHHPLPSLAADSPHFKPGGDYWLGSTWAPTNCAAIKGFDRAGRHDLAVETTLRHLRCMYEVYKDTGHIWENYCSEESKRGSWSMPEYCWSAVGPIALLFEVVIGLQADAPNQTLKWTLPDGEAMGVRNLPLGPATVSATFRPDKDHPTIDVETDRRLTLEVVYQGKTRKLACKPGWQKLEIR